MCFIIIDVFIFSGEEVLNILEREVSHQLAIIGVVAHSLSTVQVSNGPNSEILVKMLTRYYAVITSLTKHFVTRATPQNLVHRTAKYDNFPILIIYSLTQSSNLHRIVSKFLIK